MNIKSNSKTKNMLASMYSSLAMVLP